MCKSQNHWLNHQTICQKTEIPLNKIKSLTRTVIKQRPNGKPYMLSKVLDAQITLTEQKTLDNNLGSYRPIINLMCLHSNIISILEFNNSKLSWYVAIFSFSWHSLQQLPCVLLVLTFENFTLDLKAFSIFFFDCQTRSANLVVCLWFCTMFF